jgi:hypothetical protein
MGTTSLLAFTSVLNAMVQNPLWVVGDEAKPDQLVLVLPLGLTVT